jgi:hypothetical protein
VGERCPGAVRFAYSSLLAGHGSEEEEEERGLPILSRGEGYCPLCRCSCCSSVSPCFLLCLAVVAR